MKKINPFLFAVPFLVLFLLQSACTKEESKTESSEEKKNPQAIAQTTETPKALATSQPTPSAAPAKSDVLFKLPAEMKPTAEQEVLIQKLKKQYAAQIEVEQDKLINTYTEEQNKQRIEAAKQAGAEGKKGKDFADAVKKAVKLSAEQEQKIDQALKEITKFSSLIQTELAKTYTPEQKQELLEFSKKAAGSVSPSVKTEETSQKKAQKIKTKY